MSHFTVENAEENRFRIIHMKNKEMIITDLPPEYGGEGRSFSSTDLVSGAVGSCYFSTIEKILIRNGIAINTVQHNTNITDPGAHTP